MTQDAATRVPTALTIAGSDPSGGAGIQADLKTFTVLGVYGASVLTALTAQSTRGVAGILAVPPAFVTLQIATLADDLNIRAVKTGMLNDRATVAAVAAAIRQYELTPLVVDPVMVATSGDMLLEPVAVDAMRTELVPLATVLTPNLAEAARLLDRPVATNEAEMEVQARALLELGAKAVVLKGGHGQGAEAVDIFLQRGGDPVRLSLPRIATRNTHGTGCTFAAAITAYFVRGETIEGAAHAAKALRARGVAVRSTGSPSAGARDPSII